MGDARHSVCRPSTDIRNTRGGKRTPRTNFSFELYAGARPRAHSCTPLEGFSRVTCQHPSGKEQGRASWLVSCGRPDVVDLTEPSSASFPDVMGRDYVGQHGHVQEKENTSGWLY